MRPLTHVATRDIECTRCKATIKKGEKLAAFRERALSHREAATRGTQYPQRRWCSTCAAK